MVVLYRIKETFSTTPIMSLFVNGQEISREEIDTEKQRLRPQYKQTFAQMEEKAREEQLFQWCKENVIEQVLLKQTAQEMITDITDDSIAQAYQQLLSQNPAIKSVDKDKVLADIKTQLQIEKLIQQLTSNLPEPTEKQIKKLYHDNIEQFTISETVHAAHIVFHPNQDISQEKQKKKLNAILNEIKNGADFIKMANKHSDCRDNDSDLGYFSRGKMVPEFEDVVFDMEVGQVSDVFQTEFGYHIAKVLDKKPKMPCELQYVREFITNQLQQQVREKTITNFIDQQKSKAEIKYEL